MSVKKVQKVSKKDVQQISFRRKQGKKIFIFSMIDDIKIRVDEHTFEKEGVDLFSLDDCLPAGDKSSTYTIYSAKSLSLSPEESTILKYIKSELKGKTFAITNKFCREFPFLQATRIRGRIKILVDKGYLEIVTNSLSRPRYRLLEKEKKIILSLIDAIFIISSTRPLPDVSGKVWLYDGWLYTIDREYEDDEARLLILEEADKERHKFERLRRKFDSGLEQKIAKGRRERIPEGVRIEVWRRDEGKCVRCGSQENLEYDHIIPVSRGGSNTARNVQLLCEKCNREKGDLIR